MLAQRKNTSGRWEMVCLRLWDEGTASLSERWAPKAAATLAEGCAMNDTEPCRTGEGLLKACSTAPSVQGVEQQKLKIKVRQGLLFIK